MTSPMEAHQYRSPGGGYDDGAHHDGRHQPDGRDRGSPRTRAVVVTGRGARGTLVGGAVGRRRRPEHTRIGREELDVAGLVPVAAAPWWRRPAHSVSTICPVASRTSTV